MIDKDASGNLNFEEFKAFASDPESNKVFKNLI